MPSDYKAWKESKLRTVRARNRWDRVVKKPSEVSPAAYKKLLKGYREDEKRDYFYRLGVFLRDTGELIGFMSIMEIFRRVSQNAYLGYSIDSPFWGCGYGKEAVQATLELAFKDLKLHRLEAGIEPENHRSIALAKSLGMRFEGRKKRVLFLRGKWRNLLAFGITCEDLGWKFRGKAE